MQEKTAYEYLLEGLGYKEEGEYQKALDAFEKAIEINPRYTKPLINKGIVLGKLGQDNEAIECFDKAIDLDPFDDAPWYYKARLLEKFEKTGNIQEKITYCDYMAIIRKNQSFWGK